MMWRDYDGYVFFVVVMFTLIASVFVSVTAIVSAIVLFTINGMSMLLFILMGIFIIGVSITVILVQWFLDAAD